MKRSSLYTLTLLFTGLLVLFSCRKDIEYYLLDRDRPTSEVLENAKIWYLQSIDRENVRQRLKPHWKDAWTVSRGGRSPIVVVPANERRLRNRDISIRRFFIFTLRGDDVSGGNIMEFLGEKYDVTANLDFLLQSFSKEEITGFSGSFITYDINYNYINAIVFKNGKKINAITEIQNLDKNSVQQALKKHTVFGKPIKKLASATPMALYDEECDDVYPTWNGPPTSGFGEDCVVNVTVTTAYDPFSGCAISQSVTYNSHTCPGDGTGDESGSSSGEGEENPPYGGGGGGGGGSSQTSGLPLMDFCQGMSQTQKNIIISTFTNVRDMNCAANAMVLQLKQVPNLVLGMCINANATLNGNYIPNTKSIVFPTDFAAGHQDVFRHEVFHAYQDNVAYPGGIGNYGSGDPGFVNIEFEQAVFKDIMNGYASALNGSTNNVLKIDYEDWISELTTGGTSYPDISNISNFETKFFEFLTEFNASDPGYGGGTIIPTLGPEALKTIFNGLVKDNCGI